MDRRRAWYSLVLLAGLAVGLACSGGDETPAPPSGVETPKAGGTLVMGSISDVDSWNEYISQQSFAQFLLRRVYLRLAEQKPGPLSHPDGYEPSLAESWEASEDGLALTFRLREASWSDGTPIRAEDVRFTWQAQTSEHVPWIGADSKTRIRDVEVVDARTVRFHFDGAYPYQFIDAVEGGILPEHVFGQVPFERWKDHDWLTARVGSGPFVPSTHRPGEQMELVRNEHYYREGRPYLDRVVVRVVPDISNLITQLRSGEIDYLENIPLRDAHRLGEDERLEVVPFDYANYEFIGWNGAKPPFDDADVRRALTMAIDRQALVDELMAGHAKVGTGPAPSSWWGADTSLEPLPYDPQKARAILREHGYATAEGESGKKLNVTILTNAGNRTRESALVKIQSHLYKVGVDASIQPLEMRTMRGQVVSGEFDGYLGGWVFAGKIDLRGLFASAATPPNGMNIVSYSNADVDASFDRLAEVDRWEAMPEILADIQTRIAADQPYSFLYESRRVAAHSTSLAGVRIDVPSDPLIHLADYWVR
ncbi:MAG: hypothetical protein GTN89_09455 [Acidobacteria bacterium]|nr:hypothetical protein [Acidobacteriota bacterium]NIM63178.1 hypothetical protein [Acidobacteriota bacterium]NIO59566.1 hypothetical protein [Acidobacteriota bacterium]NIQ30580.1 hypothetical protein [Acidobacteriota bacterium]NIQ85546.1 hypothetical protein [Acidobacteriota bacterium]